MFAVTLICLVYMVALAAFVIYKLCSESRKNRFKYLREFKKGQFALIYVAAVPLYWIARVYAGVPTGGALLQAIKAAVELVVLKYDYPNAAALMEANLFFRITIDICFVLVAVNALIMTFALFGQAIQNKQKLLKGMLFAKKLYLIVGYDENNVHIAESVTDGQAIFFWNLNEEEREQTLLARYAHRKFDADSDNLGEAVLSFIKRNATQDVCVIINTGDDVKNLILTKQISVVLDTVEERESHSNISIYVFGEPINASAFTYFTVKTCGRVHYINRYRLAAMDFAEHYPLTRFMDKRHLDYQNGTVNSNVEINVAIVGFGKTGQEIFETAVANNQFLEIKDGEPVEKQVHYYMYDKRGLNNCKGLNHGYFRYHNEYPEMKEHERNYFELPQEPACVKSLPIAIEDAAFYEKIKENLTPHDDNIAYNYLIICFGSDLENIDLAEKLRAKLREWSLDEQTKIFVKTWDDRLATQVIAEENITSGDFFVFSNEKEEVYQIEEIVNPRMESMAKMRSVAYALEYEAENNKAFRTEDVERITEDTNVKWYTRDDDNKRQSNIFACLSLRFKLNLLGLDYCEKDANDEPALSEEEYLSIYGKGDMPRSKGTLCGKSIIQYDLNFQKSTRSILAMQEHARWNAFMITRGHIPCTKAEAVTPPMFGRDLSKRIHPNLTTFRGLEEYRRLVAEAKGKSEEELDVIKYDYQIMDDAYWLLDKNGYKIIEKKV